MNILYKMRLKRLLNVSIMFLIISLYNVYTVTATDNPLLLLDYREIDSTHFYVDVKLKDIKAVNAFTVPIAFNSDNVKICGYDSDTGEEFDIHDGVKKEEDYKDIKKGIQLGDFFRDTTNWEYSFISNDMYPVVSNTDGILSFTIFGIDDVDFDGEVQLLTICFKRISNGSPDIRIATSKNSKEYDRTAPDGALFINLDYDISVGTVYNGDVFNSDYKIDKTDNNSNNADLNDNKTNNSSGGNENLSDEEQKQDNKNQDVEKSDNSEFVDNSKKKIDFIDVNESYWAYDIISKLSSSGIINGYEDGSFRPEENVTRAEFAKILILTLKISTESNEKIFSDSDTDKWYNKYILAAYSEKLIAGYPDNSVRPEEYITREDLSVMLYRALKREVSEPTNLTFSDVGDISDYAVDAVSMLYNLKFINGYDDGTFKPYNNATRAETAKLIFSYIEYINKK